MTKLFGKSKILKLLLIITILSKNTTFIAIVARGTHKRQRLAFLSTAFIFHFNHCFGFAHLIVATARLALVRWFTVFAFVLPFPLSWCKDQT